MGNKELFKTVLFGGFQKEEVWNYMQEVEAEIEGGRQVAERAQQEYAQQLEEENLMRQKLSQQLSDEQERTEKLEEEKKIIRQNINGERTEVRPILKTEDIIAAREVVRQVYLDEKIEQYIADIVFATRYPEKYDLKELKGLIGFGGSPRASINLALAARSYAFIKRRGYVIPEDVRAVAHDVLRHRIGLTYEAEATNVTSDEIVSKILNKVEVP